MNSDSITVDIPAMSAEQFQDAVVQAAADRLLSTYGYDEDGNEHRNSSSMERRIRERMETVIREQAEKFAPVVAQTILDEGVAQVDTWGSPTGNARPLKSVIADEVTKSLRNGNTGRTGKGVLTELIAKEVRGQLAGELRAVVEDAKKPLLDAVQEEAVNVFQSAMKKALA